MPNLVVRSYQRSDREAVLRIAADTAFFGDPVEAFLDDRRLFFDAFYSYYFDYEPEYCWVACADETVVGFLAGSIETRSRVWRWMKNVLPGIAGGFLRGGYRLGRLTFLYLTKLLQEALRGATLRVDLNVYPAHLHINIEVAWRGLGSGRQLMQAYLGQLRMLGVRGVHLSTTNLNEAACRLYERLGFALLSACPTHLWEDLIKLPVEARAYGLKLLADP